MFDIDHQKAATVLHGAFYLGRGVTIGRDGELITSGLVVSLWPSLSLQITEDVVYEPNRLRQLVQHWVDEHTDERFPAEADGFGMWYDRRRRVFILDVVAVFCPGCHAAALRAARAEAQDAIWDLDNNREILADAYYMWADHW